MVSTGLEHKKKSIDNKTIAGVDNSVDINDQMWPFVTRLIIAPYPRSPSLHK